MQEQEKPPVSKRKKGIETADRILRASADLFARKGYDGVSLYEIADAAGIKESSLYNHFEGKAGILQALLDLFRERAPETRPSDAELDAMLQVLEPEEIFKTVLFYFGRHGDGLLENIARVITNEKFKNAQAAETYFQSVVREPAEYYERLIRKMEGRGMIRRTDARMLAEQYNYAVIALTKEYFMAKNGLAQMQAVLNKMLQTIRFFCGLMKGKPGDFGHETEA